MFEHVTEALQSLRHAAAHALAATTDSEQARAVERLMAAHAQLFAQLLIAQLKDQLAAKPPGSPAETVALIDSVLAAALSQLAAGDTRGAGPAGS